MSDVEVGRAHVTLTFQTDKNSKAKVESETNGLANGLKKLIGLAGLTISAAGLVSFGKQATAAAAEVKATNTQFAQTFKDLGESGEVVGDFAKQATTALEKVADQTGISTGRMKASFASLGAFYKTGGQDAQHAVDFASRASKIAADSAAYFDRSMEDTMDIMKRLMKGNFQLDDNLGFQSTQITRNADAMKMYGKKYQELESWQQQEVILQQILNANMAMGATNQAAREAMEYTNQIAEMQSATKMLSATIGQALLPIALKFIQRGVKGLSKVRDFLGDVNDENSRIAKISKGVGAAFDKVFDVIDKTSDAIGRFVDFVGGAEEALKLLSTIVGFFAAMKIASKIQQTGAAIKVLSGIFNAANMKVMAIIGVLSALFLVVQDLVFFMQGKPSLLGQVLEDKGINPDDVKAKITGVINFVKGGFDKVKGFAGKIKGLFKGGGIQKLLSKVGPAFQKIGDVLRPVGDVIGKTVGGVKELFEAFASNQNLGSGFSTLISALQPIGATLAQVGGTIGQFFAGVGAQVGPVIQSIVTVVSGGLPGVISSVSGFAQSFMDLVSVIATAVWPYLQTFAGWLQAALPYAIAAVQNVFTAIVDVITGVFNAIAPFFSGVASLIQAVISLIQGDVDGFKTNIVNAFTSFVTSAKSILDGLIQGINDLFGGLPAKGLQWATDFMQNFINGIKGMIDKVAGSVKGVADKIAGFLHFSVPDYGPLAKSDEWMPDMMSNFSNGIKKGIPKVAKLAGTVSKTISGAVDTNGFKKSIGGIGSIATRALSKISKAKPIVGGVAQSTKVAGNITNKVNDAFGKINSDVQLTAPIIDPIEVSEKPGMMSDINSVIQNGITKIGKAVTGWADIMANAMGGTQGMVALAGAGAASGAVVGHEISNSTSSVVQNVNFNNVFNGTPVENQRQASSQMQKNASDATSQLAHALAYGR